jgi:Tol biopolymer transport system component
MMKIALVLALLGCANDVPDTPPTSGLLVGTDPYIWAGNPTTRVFTRNLDGSNQTFLTDDHANREPEWSCDGNQIIYGSGAEIWIMNADGSGKQRIPTGNMVATSPSMSCTGKLVFTSFSTTTGNPTIWIMDDATSTPRQLSHDNKFDAAARISPDGTKVAFTRYLDFDHTTHTDSGREIFVINADGTGEQQLTFVTDDVNAPNANAPAWSPDSKRIAFFNGFEEDGPNRTTPDVRHLAVINADGSDRQRLTHCDVTTRDINDSKSPGACADDPNWLSDGNWIIYSSSGMNTYIVAADGSGSPQLFLPGLVLFGHGGGRPVKPLE